jgi:hypothetical protein
MEHERPCSSDKKLCQTVTHNSHAIPMSGLPVIRNHERSFVAIRTIMIHHIGLQA